MGWSIKLFDVAGTAVRVHLTFFLLLAWIGAIHWKRGGPAAAVDGVIFIVLLFVCVLLHEFGHVFAARRYGIRTPDVTLLPIGGVASLERMPEKPSQEIVVALAGPAVNLVIALVLVFVLGARFDLTQMAQLQEATSTLTGRVAAANVALLVFNLIPAFPMDGGRVLRALLAMPLGYTRATRDRRHDRPGAGVRVRLHRPDGQSAAGADRGVHLPGRQRRGRLRADARLHARLSRLARHDHRLPDAEPRLDRRRCRAAAAAHDAAGVSGRGRRRRPARRAHPRGADRRAARHGGATPVLDVMTRDVPTVPENACLDNVFQIAAARGPRFVGVVDPRQRLVGYITAENLAELVMIQSSRAAQRRPHRRRRQGGCRQIGA